MPPLPPPSAPPLRRALAAAFALLAALAWAAAGAQGQREASVVIGFGHELVSGAWNPLRVTLRDVPDATLEIRFDQGSLRDGEIAVLYRAELDGGGGLHVFEDDVWVPDWRSLLWSVASGERVWGSGSLGARDRDERPLQLLLTSDPGRFRSAYPSDARISETTAAELPERGAAYDGVATLLIDGSAAAPRLDAVAAAAAAGVTVVIVEPLPDSHRELALIAPGADNPLGAGRVLRSAARDLPTALARRSEIDPDALRERLAESLAVSAPALPPLRSAAAALAIYTLATLLLLRFGRLPGALAALAVAGLLSAAGWRALHPERTTFRDDARLEVSAAGLALRSASSELLTLPAGWQQLDEVAHGGPDRPYQLSPSGIRYPVQRWSRDRIELRPVLVPPSLERDGDGVRAPRGGVREVFVVGYGPLGDLAAGSAVALPAATTAAAPRAYSAIIGALPIGSAVATAADGAVLLALPTGDPGAVPAPAPLIVPEPAPRPDLPPGPFSAPPRDPADTAPSAPAGPSDPAPAPVPAPDLDPRERNPFSLPSAGPSDATPDPAADPASEAAPADPPADESTAAPSEAAP